MVAIANALHRDCLKIMLGKECCVFVTLKFSLHYSKILFTFLKHKSVSVGGLTSLIHFACLGHQVLFFTIDNEFFP